MSTRGVSTHADAPADEPVDRRRTRHFDAASGEPLHPAAREVLLSAHDDGWADPARLYGSARRARMLLDNAREIVAAVLGCRPDEVSFTAGGTHAVHSAVLGAFAARERARSEIVVSAVEHSSVLHSAAALGPQGAVTRQVGVDGLGSVDADEFARAIHPASVLACLQTANHEVGTVQPVDEVAEHCERHGVALLTDAAQAVGRTELPTRWSLLTASAHKWGGPPGVGVLAVRRGARWRSPWPEDERENGRVPGVQNVPGVLAAAAALRARAEEAAELATRHAELTERIRARVPGLLSDVDVVGHPRHRLPHLVTFSCLYLDGEALVTELDRAGYAVSSGSSCTSSTLQPSHVLEAMGALTHGNVRVSLGPDVTIDEVDEFLAVVTDVVGRLRQEAAAP
ncbi:cysteine desulfurase [Haloactinopolyspora alba]|uniref:Cysteine desulfurase n=1 Tax=Haloactinopolyspora alba TaxID=648780 RepID=A0A2P8DR79_9ACTN|nr:aminotransferase class V-fold PLP-dependent enzyme [Haloactinopolyspora alba]PSK99721.1 cysteine desulfurase [Haloactinopolyspora alba]